MKRTALLLMIVMAVLAGCAGGAEESGGDSGGVSRQEAAEDAAMAGAEGGGDAAQEAAPASGEAGGGDGVDIAAAVSQTAAIGDRIVRNGTMRLRVEDDTFDAAFERLVGLADRFGGTVVASDVMNTDNGSTSGTVTLRVPAGDFDELLVAVGRIGEVERRSITTEDVSVEFVDLEARLRHNHAQEAFYLSLLDRADDVEDAIAVQQRVEGIQQTIEQIKGRLSFLEERTSFSRLTVELFESGAAFQTASGERPTFAHYLGTARDALVTVIGGTLVVATVALPFVVGGVVLLLLFRRFAPALRRAEPTGPPAPASAPER